MHYLFKSILIAAVFLMPRFAFCGDSSKYETGIRVGNYYNMNSHFRHPRYSHSEGLYFSRDFSKNRRLELSVQRGSFQYFTPGFATYSRGVNSRYIDNNFSIQGFKSVKLKREYQLSFGLGLAFTRHFYTEPGYNVYFIIRGNGDKEIWGMGSDFEVRSYDISMPLCVDVHREFHSGIIFRGRFQHFLTPYSIENFGYGTSVNFGIGYRL